MPNQVGKPLANHERAQVAERKVTHYLLSEAHPDAKGKARFFHALGFEGHDWQVFAEALRRHAAENAVTLIVETSFGQRLVVEGILHGASGRSAPVRVVWFIERGERTPRLVTAYPLRRSQHDP